MGILDSILGGSSNDQTVTTKTTLPSWLKGAQNDVFQNFLGAYNDQQAQNVGGLNPTQQQALTGIQGIATGGTPQVQQGLDFLGGQLGGTGLTTGQQGLSDQLINGQLTNPAMAQASSIAGGSQLGGNPFLDSQYQNAAKQVTDAFSNYTAPAIAGRWQAAGGRLASPSFAQDLGQQGQMQVGNTLSSLAANLYGNAYNEDANRQMQALGLQAQLGQQGVNNKLSGAGLQQQGTANQLGALGFIPAYQQAQYGDLRQLLGVGDTEANAPYAPGSAFLNALAPITASRAGTTQSQPTYDSGLLQQTLGAGAQGLGLAAMLGWSPLAATAAAGSDRRIKKDIRRVGTTSAGLPIYTFKYKADPDGVTHMGVMAQDVAEVFPDAVVTMPEGHLGVIYDRIG